MNQTILFQKLLSATNSHIKETDSTIYQNRLDFLTEYSIEYANRSTKGIRDYMYRLLNHPLYGCLIQHVEYYRSNHGYVVLFSPPKDNNKSWIEYELMMTHGFERIQPLLCKDANTFVKRFPKHIY